jgi:hypothetical protein
MLNLKIQRQPSMLVLLRRLLDTDTSSCPDRLSRCLPTIEADQEGNKNKTKRTKFGVPLPNLPRRYGLSGSLPSLKRPPPPPSPLRPPEKTAKPEGRLNHGRPDRSLHVRNAFWGAYNPEHQEGRANEGAV